MKRLTMVVILNRLYNKFTTNVDRKLENSSCAHTVDFITSSERFTEAIKICKSKRYFYGSISIGNFPDFLRVCVHISAVYLESLHNRRIPDNLLLISAVFSCPLGGRHCPELPKPAGRFGQTDGITLQHFKYNTSLCNHHRCHLLGIKIEF